MVSWQRPLVNVLAHTWKYIMAKKKQKVPKPRDPNAKALEDTLFRQRVVPNKKQKQDEGPKVEEWD
jgi:hypothetical protein